MIRKFDIKPDEYQKIKPFPYYKMDNALNEDFAKALQNEIIQHFNSEPQQYDRYNNQFEQKYTLRDKLNYSTHLKTLFEYLESDSFISELSTLSGFTLLKDKNRNFNGVHLYDNNDKLDIHVDAGKHPIQGLKKQITLGIYLSLNWNKDYKCELEIWKGDNAGNSNPQIYECIDKIEPLKYINIIC